jgi:hypothetical protein
VHLGCAGEVKTLFRARDTASLRGAGCITLPAQATPGRAGLLICWAFAYARAARRARVMSSPSNQECREMSSRYSGISEGERPKTVVWRAGERSGSAEPQTMSARQDQETPRRAVYQGGQHNGFGFT